MNKLSLFNLKKYKINLFINFENSINYNKVKQKNNKINYLFKHKNKIFRNFILFFSVFLIFNQYSNFNYKSNLEYNIKFNLIYFLIIDNNVILF